MLIERQRGLCIGAAVVQVARVCWFVEKAYGRIRDSVLACYSTGGLSTVLLAILCWFVEKVYGWIRDSVFCYSTAGCPQYSWQYFGSLSSGVGAWKAWTGVKRSFRWRGWTRGGMGGGLCTGDMQSERPLYWGCHSTCGLSTVLLAILWLVAFASSSTLIK